MNNCTLFTYIVQSSEFTLPQISITIHVCRQGIIACNNNNMCKNISFYFFTFYIPVAMSNKLFANYSMMSIVMAFPCNFTWLQLAFEQEWVFIDKGYSRGVTRIIRAMGRRHGRLLVPRLRMRMNRCCQWEDLGLATLRHRLAIALTWLAWLFRQADLNK